MKADGKMSKESNQSNQHCLELMALPVPTSSCLRGVVMPPGMLELV